MKDIKGAILEDPVSEEGDGFDARRTLEIPPDPLPDVRTLRLQCSIPAIRKELATEGISAELKKYFALAMVATDPSLTPAEAAEVQAAQAKFDEWSAAHGSFSGNSILLQKRKVIEEMYASSPKGLLESAAKLSLLNTDEALSRARDVARRSMAGFAMKAQPLIIAAFRREIEAVRAKYLQAEAIDLAPLGLNAEYLLNDYRRIFADLHRGFEHACTPVDPIGGRCYSPRSMAGMLFRKWELAPMHQKGE